YIDYKTLKKLIRVGTERSENPTESDFKEFQECLDNNALKVEDFFNKRFDVYSGDLAVLEKRHPVSSIGDLDEDGCVELRDTLIELKTHLRKLGWYAEVNRRGFRKILKKLDKK
ncbi:putative ankyrin repeat protein, partial [Yarrowia lipolytica]